MINDKAVSVSPSPCTGRDYRVTNQRTRVNIVFFTAQRVGRACTLDFQIAEDTINIKTMFKKSAHSEQLKHTVYDIPVTSLSRPSLYGERV